jgi:hypothetical protein
MPRMPAKTFTDKELEIMRLVWKRGEATAKRGRYGKGEKR